MERTKSIEWSRSTRAAATSALRLWLVCSACAVLLGIAPKSMAAPGDTVVRSWPNRAQAAFSITLDDGAANQWRYMAPLLTSRGLRGTFFLISSWPDADETWSSWKAVAAAGHEIGSHTVNHPRLPALSAEELFVELSSSRERLRTMLGPQVAQVFAYPYSETNEQVVASVERAGYKAARCGPGPLNPITPQDFFQIKARAPVSTNTLQEMTGWIDEVLDSGRWLFINIHGVYDPNHRYNANNEGDDPLPLDDYASLFDYSLAKGADLFIAPLGDVVDFIRARDAVNVSTSMQGDSITITCNGTPGGPWITLETEVAMTWTHASLALADAGPPVIVPTTRAGETRVLTYNVRPPVTVHIGETAGSDGGSIDAGASVPNLGEAPDASIADISVSDSALLPDGAITDAVSDPSRRDVSMQYSDGTDIDSRAQQHYPDVQYADSPSIVTGAHDASEGSCACRSAGTGGRAGSMGNGVLWLLLAVVSSSRRRIRGNTAICIKRSGMPCR